MKEKVPLFHLRIIEFPVEFDLAFGLFRQIKLDAIIQQLNYSQNEYDLPVDTDIPISFRVQSVEILNHETKFVRVGGSLVFCNELKLFGRYSFDFSFEVYLNDQTGTGAVWHE